MKRKNIAAMVTSIALVGAVAVGGTLALLTSQTEDLTNTFTVGSGYTNTTFSLQEDYVIQAANDQYVEEVKTVTAGDYIDDPERQTTTDGQAYRDVIPGSSLHKNPFFSLTKNDKEGAAVPESWIVARVSVEQLEALEAEGISFTGVNFGEEGPVWYQVKQEDSTWGIVTDQEGNPAPITKATYNVPTNAVGDYLYFVYSDSLAENGTTKSLFDTLSAAETMTNWTGDLNLTIEGVAVQKLDGATLEGSLQTIMSDAAGALDA